MITYDIIIACILVCIVCFILGFMSAPRLSTEILNKSDIETFQPMTDGLVIQLRSENVRLETLLLRSENERIELVNKLNLHFAVVLEHNNKRYNCD